MIIVIQCYQLLVIFTDFFLFVGLWVECDCDVGGSYGPVCNKASGQCKCKANVTQRQCNRFGKITVLKKIEMLCFVLFCFVLFLSRKIKIKNKNVIHQPRLVCMP